jgi:hypothetical protein
LIKSWKSNEQGAWSEVLNLHACHCFTNIQLYPVSEGYLRKIPVERRGKQISWAALVARDIWLYSWGNVFFSHNASIWIWDTPILKKTPWTLIPFPFSKFF